MVYRYLFLSLLPLYLFGCLDQLVSPSPTPSNHKIQPSANHPGYWSWDGADPVLLLGAGGDKQAYLDPDFSQKLNILEDNGGNFTSVTLNLDWLDVELDSLLLYLEAASQKKIAVEVTITANPTKSAGEMEEQIKQFDQAIGQTARYDNVLYQLDLTNLTAFLPILSKRKPNAVLAGVDYRSKLSGAKQLRGYNHWLQLQDSLKPRPDQLPFHCTDIVNFNQVAAEGIAGFNRSVLAGAAAVRHRARPQGDGFSGPALAGIRAIRTVENHFNFWELQPAPQIIPNASPNQAYAMTDGNNGYLVYLPTAGSVNLQLDLKVQIPLRVIVVGYLGTQKSEVLEPPYEDGFTLFTDEPRGGWMLIKPER